MDQLVSSYRFDSGSDSPFWVLSQLAAKRNGKPIVVEDFWSLGISLCIVALSINMVFLIEKLNEAQKAGVALANGIVDQFWGLTVSLIVVLAVMTVYQRFMPATSPVLVTALVLIPSVLVGIGSNGLIMFAWSN